MEQRRHLVLTGFMGTGKTTIGRILAAHFHRPFVDTDDLITQQAGHSVAAIFADEGEAAFRAWEQRVAEHLAGERGLVIATGGGFFLNPANLALLAPVSQIICLTARPETLVRRLQHNNSRPLLLAADRLARIQALLAARAEIYDQFPQIETDDRSLQTVTKEVLRLWQESSLLSRH